MRFWRGRRLDLDRFIAEPAFFPHGRTDVECDRHLVLSAGNALPLGAEIGRPHLIESRFLPLGNSFGRRPGAVRFSAYGPQALRWGFL
jgi:hypothetical protein